MISLLKKDFIFSRLVFILSYIMMICMSFFMNLYTEIIYFEFKIVIASIIVIWGIIYGPLVEKEWIRTNASELLVAIGYSRKHQVLERYVLALIGCIIAIITEVIIGLYLIIFWDMQFSFNFFGVINAIVFLILFINLSIFIIYSNRIVKNAFFFSFVMGSVILEFLGINFKFLTISKYVGLYFMIPTIIITIGTFKLCVFLDEKKYK